MSRARPGLHLDHNGAMRAPWTDWIPPREVVRIYALAWLPFVVLVLIGWVLLRRVRTRSGSLLPAPDDAFAPVPPPRSPSGNRRP